MDANDKLVKLQSWKKSGQFCDLVITLGGTELSCHACLLSAAVPFFEERLKPIWNTMMVKQYQLNLDRSALSREAVHAVVNHVYGLPHRLTRDNVSLILEGASKLGYKPLADECLIFIREEMNFENALDWFVSAKKYGTDELVSALRKLIKEDFVEIAKSRSFLRLPRVTVDAITEECQELNKAKLFQNILRYIQGSEKGMNPKTLSEKSITLYVSEAMSVSRKPLLPKAIGEVEEDFFQSPARSNHFSLGQQTAGTGKVFGKSPARELLPSDRKRHCEVIASIHQRASTLAVLYSTSTSEVFVLNVTFHLAKDEESRASPTTGIIMADELPLVSFLPSLQEARANFGCVATSAGIYVIGGYNRHRCLSSVEMYSKDRCWCHLPNTAERRGRFEALLVDRSIYAFGGSNGSSELKTVEVFNPSDEEWKRVSTLMPSSRSLFAATTLEGMVYLIGGSRQSQAIQQVDCFDPIRLTWSKLKPLNVARSDLVAVAHKGFLYVLGGSNGYQSLSSVERYNFELGVWEDCPPMTVPRRSAAAVVHRESIFVFGGYDGKDILSSVEVFSLEKNIWTDGEPMLFPRSGAKSVIYEGDIYIIGGYSNWGFLSTMECYDHIP